MQHHHTRHLGVLESRAIVGVLSVSGSPATGVGGRFNSPPPPLLAPVCCQTWTGQISILPRHFPPKIFILCCSQRIGRNIAPFHWGAEVTGTESLYPTLES